MFLTPMLREPSRQWSLVDADTGTTVATHVEAAFDSRTRKKGLLGRSGLGTTSLIIAPCNAVHTFFMRFSIDVVFTDREGRVLKICADVRPWKIAAAWRGFAAIELEAGAASRAGIGAGHSLAVIER